MSARYEFRAWTGVTDAAEALREVSRRSWSETVRDCYVVTRNQDVNAKIRNESLEVKRLVQRRGDLEQWAPSWSEEAPFDGETVDRLFDELGVEPPPAGHSGLDVDGLTGLLRSRLDAVWVTKRRNHHELDRHLLDEVLAEETEIEVERTGDVLRCIALESEDPDAVNELRRRIGLVGSENLPVDRAVARSLEG